MIKVEGETYKSEPEKDMCRECAFLYDIKSCRSMEKLVDCESNSIIWKEVSDFNGQSFVTSSVSNFITNDLTKVPIITVPNQEIRVTNEKGGVKADGGKLRPTLLLKNLPDAIQAVIRILELGAKKYGDTNYLLVEPERYDDANLRHILAYLSGDSLDSESKESHLAHAITCLLFRLQLDYNNDKDLTLPRK